MEERAVQKQSSFPIANWLKVLIIVSLFLGICLRFYSFDGKVYSFDETYTSTYMYGQHSKAYSNFDGPVLSVTDLKNYTFLDPEKTPIQSLQAIIKKVYLFPPLYPILGLFWSYLLAPFHDNPLVIQRSISALFGSIAVLGTYWLGKELFESKTVACIAATLVAISPFHLQYAHIIRTYSLWTATTVCSCACLLKATRSKNRFYWALYALSVSASLYANLLFGFALIAHTAYIIISEKFKITRNVILFFLSSGIGVLTFLPWFWVYLNSNALGYSVTQVVTSQLSFWELARSWLKNLQILFVDCYNYWFSPIILRYVQWLVTPIVFATIGFSLYTICRHASAKVRTFLIGLAIAAGVSLMLKDSLTSSIYSTRLRYLIPYALSIELMVAYSIGSLLSATVPHVKRSSQIRWGQFSLIALFLGGAISCIAIARAPTWSAFGSPNFPEASAIVSAADRPLVIVTSLDRALSMSYLVDSDTKFKMLKNTTTIPDGFDTIFVLEPNKKVREKLKAKHTLEQIDSFGRLFQLKVSTYNDGRVAP